MTIEQIQHTEATGSRCQENTVLGFRKTLAALMTPYMFQGLELAEQRAAGIGLTDPSLRYTLLMATTMKHLKRPDLRQAHLDNYPSFAPHFVDRTHYERVYDKYLPELIRPAIQDAYMVGCGAAELLENEGRSPEASTIIPRSTGLLAVSHVSKQGMVELRSRLGNPVDPLYLCMKSVAGLERVAFTDEAKRIIGEYPSPLGGCSAYTLEDPRPDGTAPNLLIAYWQESARYAFGAAESAA